MKIKTYEICEKCGKPCKVEIEAFGRKDIVPVKCECESEGKEE